MADSGATIEFLRACYEADNRQTAIANLFNKSIRHLQFIEGEERLLCDLLPRIPMMSEAASAAMKDAQLYRREKNLLYCAFPIVGRLPARGPQKSSTKLCAPLLFYPARLVEEEATIQLEIDLTQQQVNVPVLADLAAASDAVDAELDELISEFPQAPLGRDDVQILIALLQDFFPAMDALSLAQYPALHSEKQVRQIVKNVASRSKKLTCLPACALALTPNSPNTRGVLYELEQMTANQRLSKPLAIVLGQRRPHAKQAKLREATRVPAVLSRAQQQVLASAATSPLTLVIGPPGTGKSYTIAALAVDHIARGESVLIACRKPQAVDVVARMIEELLGPNECVIRGGESRHVRELKKSLEHLLQGIKRQIRSSIPRKHGISDNPNRELAHLDRQMQRLEADLTQQLADELRYGELISEESSGFVAKLVRTWRLMWLQKRLTRKPAFWDRVQTYDQALDASNELTRELLKQRIDDRIERTLKDHRQALTRFLSSLRSRSSTRQEELFGEIDPKLLLGTFPVWLTNVADVAELVPLETEMFDVAIFDEATQCDMASALPILQRAKRAVVVGDPNQLRHVSFLSMARQRDLGESYGLDQQDIERLHYRDNSLLDLIDEAIVSQDNVHFLNEHFRSMPAIIRFSNEKFYQNSLSVMRMHPKTTTAKCIFTHHVSEGKKEGGANPPESEALVGELTRLIEAQAPLPPQACQSIGVLSPFREQVDLLGEMLQEQLTLDAFKRHDLRIGTAHAFQGDERDVMFLSWVIDNDAHHSSHRFVENPNLFNVAITRARHQQHVFHSVNREHLATDSLLRQYLAAISHLAPPQSPARSVVDKCLNDVRAALEAEGFRVWPDYELAGVVIDLVVEKEGSTQGIDLVGCPGDYGAALDLERYRILRRAGLPLFPLPYRCWVEDREACISAMIG